MPIVKLVNTNHGEMIRNMLEESLERDLFTDTILHFPDSGPQKTLRCHRLVLMSASPLLKGLLGGSSSSLSQFSGFDECSSGSMIHVSLPGVNIEDASRIMSLIYKGSMQVPQDSILHTSQIIELLRLKVQNSNNLEQVRKPSKRPLLIKQTTRHQPLILVLPSSGSQGPSDSRSPPSKGLKAPSSSRGPKVQDKNKFTCDECGRGFPLPCLLKRHKTAHSGIKPFACVYCEKTFISGSSLRHHEFSKHLDERIRRRKEAQRASSKLRAAQSVTIYRAENSMDGSEVYIETGGGMKMEEVSPPVTVLETSQTDMDTVIEIVDTSSASEDSGITTYSIRSSTPTETPILYNMDIQSEIQPSSKSVFWTLS